jgi:hypothetical protein
MFNPASIAQARGGGGGPMRLIRRLVLLAFAVIQLLLVARILLDLGIIPAEGTIADYVVPLSDALAAPVAGLGGGLGGLFGGGAVPGIGPVAGEGLNPAMLGALAGWTIVEGLVLRVVGKFAAV